MSERRRAACHRRPVDAALRHPVPTIAAAPNDLTRGCSRERQPDKRARLHAFVAARQAGGSQSCQKVATVHRSVRTTVGRWRTRSADGGVTALLDNSVPAGTRKPSTPGQFETLRHGLAVPHNCASFNAVHQRLVATFGPLIPLSATPTLVRCTPGATLNVPRPSHTYQAEAVAAVPSATRAETSTVWALGNSRLGVAGRSAAAQHRPFTRRSLPSAWRGTLRWRMMVQP